MTKNSGQALMPGRRCAARNGLLRAEEEVLSRIRHTRHLTEVIGVAIGGRRQTPGGVDALDVADIGKNTRALRAFGCKQQPRDGSWIYRRAGQPRTDDFAAALTFPGRAGIVN